jgi:hypothetical protein
MKRLTTFFCIVSIIFSCNNADDSGKDEFVDTSITAGETSSADRIQASQKDTVPQNIQVDSVIHLSFAPGTNSVQVKGHLDKKGEPVICFLPVVQGKKLTASVYAENKKATIRFSQVYLPDGKSDGPFGQTLSYNLPQKGLYKFHISPNKMAGDPASTDFVLNVKVE